MDVVWTLIERININLLHLLHLLNELNAPVIFFVFFLFIYIHCITFFFNFFFYYFIYILIATPAPETFLRKRKRTEELAAKRTVNLKKAAAKRKSRRADAFKRAEKYVKEYRQKEADIIRYKRQAKNAGGLYKAPESGVLLVVRIRGIMRMAPKTKKILQLLRLRQVQNAVFVKNNKATINMLRMVEPYVTYGPPTVKTVSDLIYKRGYGKVNKQRIPLTNNKIIEDSLGSFGVVCIEDIIHEIVTVGDNFKQVNNFLWPFKLSSPLGGYVKKRIHYSEGGDAGRRGQDINTLIKRMN